MQRLRFPALLLLLASLGLGALHGEDAAGPPLTLPTHWGEGFSLLDGDRLATPLGPVSIDPSQLADPRLARDLHQVVETCATAGVVAADGHPWTLAFSQLGGGWSLRGDGISLQRHGVTQRTERLQPDLAPLLDALRSSTAQLQTVVASAELRPLVRLALATSCAHLVDADPAEPWLAPALLRDLFSAGYLRPHLGELPELAAVEAALAAARVPHPVERWQGKDGLRVELSRDAFGSLSGRMQTATEVVLLHAAPRPDDVATGPLWLRIAFPTDREGDYDAADIDLYSDSGPALASWNRERGLHDVSPRWRQVFPDMAGTDLLPGQLPPHLAVADREGRLLFLAVPGGVLQAPSAAASDHERFLGDAARLLPDAAHLDLIGRYCYTYTYDSPDPSAPELVGSEELTGDIHQTAEQLLARSVAGRCRGDCDDYAEFQHAILARQGRNPIIIDLPGHLACAWAERLEAGWAVQVLQTGPTLRFEAAELPDALRACYRHFDPTDDRDPRIVSLTLRFAGENTRSSFWLSWRIFAEPEYAGILFDVQRDLYFATYGKGFRTMEALIASGDEDPANWSEIAGLCSHTGQWRRSADYLGRTIALQTDPEVRFRYEVERLGEWAHGGFWSEVLPEAERLLGQVGQLPLDRLHRLQWQQAIVALLDAEDQPEVDAARRRLFAAHLLEEAEACQAALIHIDREQELSPRDWQDDPHLRAWSGLDAQLVGLAQEILRDLPDGGLPGDDALVDGCTRLVQRFADQRLTTGHTTAISLIGAYAWLAHWYREQLGPAVLDGLIEATPWPEVVPSVPPAPRIGGLPQVRRDAPWIKLSPAYRALLLNELLFADEGQEQTAVVVDAELRRRFTEQQETFTRLRALIGDSRGLDEQQREADLLRAVVLGDDAALRSCWQDLLALDDRTVHRDMTMALARALRLCTPERATALLEAWFRNVAHKPSALRLAWTLVLWKSYDLGVTTARHAATVFADDPAFTIERDFIIQRVQELQAEQADRAGGDRDLKP